MKRTLLAAAAALLTLLPAALCAQSPDAATAANAATSDAAETDLAHLSWTRVACHMPDAWYATEQAAALADTVLTAQLACGGWFKNLPYHKLEPKHRRELAKAQQSGIGIFDNDATTTEMRFLAKVYAHRPEARYAEGFRRALEFVFAAQYANGGWPMFYPLTPECLRTYGVTDPVTRKKYVSHITFNDNAMVNLLTLLRQIARRDPAYAPLVGDAEAARAERAFFDGVQCILDCQIRGTYEQYEFGRTEQGGVIVGDRRTGDGPLTVWCAQHDAETLEPAQARAYEYPSYSGGESAGILKLLMSINPKDIPADRPAMWEAIKTSVVAAAEWFDAHRIEGKRYERRMTGGKPDRVLVDAPGERDLWARFYELGTCRPIFGMYDFVRLYDLNEVSQERRMGYGWYQTSLAEILSKRYPKWRAKYIDK